MRVAQTSMRRRAIALLVAALGLLLFALWWALTPEPSLRSHDGNPVDSPRVATDETVDVSMPEPERETPIAESPRETVAARSEVISRQGFLLHGTLWVRGPDGRDDTTPSGSFDAITAHGTVHATVVNGEWSARVSGRVSAMTVAGVVIDGRDPIVVEPSLRVPRSGRVDVRVRWPAPVVVHVVDAGTKVELREVVLTVGGTRSDLTTIEESRVLARGDSPLTLERHASSRFKDARSLRIAAHAPGYVAGDESVDCANGGNYTISLASGAALEVAVRGTDAHATLALRVAVREWQEEITEESYLQGMAQLFDLLQDPDQPVPRPSDDDLRREFHANKERSLGLALREVPASLRDVTVIEGLVPGTYLVTAELDTSGPEVVLARERVELVAGQRSVVTLTLAAPPPRVQGAPLSGTLIVPAGWPAQSPSLSVMLLQRAGVISSAADHPDVAPTPIAGMPGSYSWDAGLVTPGRHWIDIDLASATFRVEIDVGSEGRRDVALRLPPPARVDVSVVDDQSGEAAEAENVSWSWSGADGLHGESHFWSKHEKLVAPAGSVILQAYSERYPHIRATQSLVHGENQVILRAKRAAGVEITFSDGTSRIECPVSIRNALSLERVDGSDLMVISSEHGDQIVFTVSRPGRYRLTIPDTSGYRPVPAVELILRDGELLKHEIVLHRE